MRKHVLILLAVVLCISLVFVSCDDEDATESPVNMTEDYRAARNAFYKSTKIWMPELDDIGVSSISLYYYPEPRTTVVLYGGEALFNKIVDTFQAQIKDNPTVNEIKEKEWDSWKYTGDNGKLYTGTININYCKVGDNYVVNLDGHFFPST